MAPHRYNEPGVVETSETELISGTESQSSDQSHIRKQYTDTSVSLERFFDQLSEEVKGSQSDKLKADDLEEVKASLSRLPKIESNLERNLEKRVSQNDSTKRILKLHDPIQLKVPKKKQDQDAGDKWFNIKEPEITPSMRRDLTLIKQRGALDPKRHYKKDKMEISKFFQMGTIIEGNTEFYSSRLSNKDRGNNLVEEILNDDDSKKYFKRKYSEIQQSKTSGGKAHYKKVRDKRKKF